MQPYSPQIEPWPTDLRGAFPVSEIFPSIQGEGRHAGCPAICIRFKYCNLGCVWCDTRFTWDPRKIETGELMQATELTQRVASLVDAPHRGQTHVVLTGGEPMLHQRDLPRLVASLRQTGFEFFEIETNGMYAPPEELRAAIDWWNCSPKLTNNGLPSNVNIVPDALRGIASTNRADFKFVVRDDADITEIERDYLPLLPRDRIMLMPEGVTAERQLALMPWVVEQCAKHGFRFSPRLHILIWGNERGR